MLKLAQARGWPDRVVSAQVNPLQGIQAAAKASATFADDVVYAQGVQVPASSLRVLVVDAACVD